MALIYVVSSMTLLFAFASLAVDLARVQVAKTELRSVADAAARAAVGGLTTSITQAQTNAVNIAATNGADGYSVTLVPSTDIEFGTWSTSTRTFTVLTGTARSGANAVRVTARRTAATNNAVPLLFARAIGMQSCDVWAQGIASSKPTGYGVIGMNYIKMGGNATDSYWSTNGYSAGNYGAIGSNGDITLSGSSAVHGDANPGIGHSVIGSSAVSGSTAPVTTPFVYPVATAGAYATTNDDGQIPSSAMNSTSFNPGSNKSYTLPGGNYYFNNFTVGSNNSVTFTGPTTLYVYGDFNLSGGATTASSVPGNLTINMIRNPYTGVAGTLRVSSGTDLYANIYAPESAVIMSGNGDIYGSVVGLTVDMTGNSSIHYDLNLSGNSGTISLVK